VDHGGRVSASGEAAPPTEQDGPKTASSCPKWGAAPPPRRPARPVTTGRSAPATALLRIHHW